MRADRAFSVVGWAGCLLFASCTESSVGPTAGAGGDAGAVASEPDAAPSPVDDGGSPPVDAGPTADASPPTDVGSPPVTAPRSFRFKRFDQLQGELERVLALAPNEVCRELDRFDCATDVHRVALGGSEPYFANVYDPAAEPPLNMPLAWERVVLTACAHRVDRDLDDPGEAAWLTEVVIDGDGRLDPSASATEDAVRRLYREAFLRNPTDAELAGWLDAYRQIEAEEPDGRPARSWARALCAAVLTSGEFVFY